MRCAKLCTTFMQNFPFKHCLCLLEVLYSARLQCLVSLDEAMVLAVWQFSCFVQVWRARCKPLGELVAVKEVDLWAAGDNVVSFDHV